MLRKDRIIQGWRLLSVFTTRINMKIACIYCLLFKNREDTERGTGDSRRLLHSSDGSQVQVGSERWRPGAESKLHLIWTRLPEWSLVPPRVYRKLESASLLGQAPTPVVYQGSFLSKSLGCLYYTREKGFCFFCCKGKRKGVCRAYIWHIRYSISITAYIPCRGTWVPWEWHLCFLLMCIVGGSRWSVWVPVTEQQTFRHLGTESIGGSFQGLSDCVSVCPSVSWTK